jgi:hypothetical protein
MTAIIIATTFTAWVAVVGACAVYMAIKGG